MNENEKSYLVSYCYNEKEHGVGYMTFSTSSKITRDFMKEITAKIEKEYKVKNIVIFNIVNLDNL